MIPLMIH
ncbi:unnamed protein product, partial [Rotaria magnacalcarata]